MEDGRLPTKEELDAQCDETSRKYSDSSSKETDTKKGDGCPTKEELNAKDAEKNNSADEPPKEIDALLYKYCHSLLNKVLFEKSEETPNFNLVTLKYHKDHILKRNFFTPKAKENEPGVQAEENEPRASADKALGPFKYFELPLNLIKKGESNVKNGYGVIVHNLEKNPAMPAIIKAINPEATSIEHLTIAEIFLLQDNFLKKKLSDDTVINGKFPREIVNESWVPSEIQSNAIGAYQFTKNTLGDMLRLAKNKKIPIDKNSKYNKDTQDILGQLLLVDRGYLEFLNGEKSAGDFYYSCLCKRFACFGLEKGRLNHQQETAKQDTSYYDGVGGNIANIKSEEALEVLNKAKKQYQQENMMKAKENNVTISVKK